MLPAWPELEHVFTHFRLIITPQPVRIDQFRAAGVAEADGQWLDIDQAMDAGVPAPVRRLLLRLAQV
jgi:A/G-specific adenine glycosylase